MYGPTAPRGHTRREFLATGGVLAGALASVGPAAVWGREPVKARFLLDNDGTNLFAGTLTDDITACIEETVWECPANVTTYLLCPNACGRFLYPTRVGEVCPPAQVLAQALERGIDPFGMLLGALRRSGKETLITYRMNDVHGANEPDRPGTADFRKRYPDLVVDPAAAAGGTADWMSYCLDYSKEPVQDYILAIIVELLSMYDVDGLQLDWMRFPRHLSGTPDEVWAKRSAITEFTAKVRRVLREFRGRDAVLSARIPTSAEGCRYLGLDVAEWTDQGLVDMLVLHPFLTTDFTMPVEHMRARAGGGSVPLYAGFDFGHGGQNHTPESLRGAATSLYDCGADGIYVFNFPCWQEYVAARPYRWLEGLESPETASENPLLLAPPHSMHRIANVDQPGCIPAPIPAEGALTVPIHIPARALPITRALLLTQSGGDVTVEVNGVPTEELPALRRSELFPEHIAHDQPRPAMADCRVFALDPAALRAGPADITVRRACPQELSVMRLNLGLW